jgi:hypothetical protein
MFRVYARNVRVRLKTPSGVGVLGVHGADLREPLGGVQELLLGEFAVGEERSLLFRLRLPPADVGQRFDLQFFLHFERSAPERRTRFERKISLTVADQEAGASKYVDAYARLVLGMDQVRRALEGQQDMAASAVVELLEKDFPALKATAVGSGDGELIRQAQLFEHFAGRLRDLYRAGRLQGASVERDELRKDFYYRRDPQVIARNS